MKVIILDGIVTMGKTCLGRKLKEGIPGFNSLYDPIHFNDDLRTKFNWGLLGLKKDPEMRKNITVDLASDFLLNIYDKLLLHEQKQNSQFFYILDRFHYSYVDSLGVDISAFNDLENRIRNNSFYICLNMKNPSSKDFYYRIKYSLITRGDHPFNTKHFYRLVGDSDSPKEQEEKLWSHYAKKIETYDKTFENTTLQKKMIDVNNIIDIEDYKIAYDLISSDIQNFLLE